MSMNPWNVQSIHDFNFFCCPECVYRSKEEFAFQAHALQNHSLSTTFFHGVENAEENHEHQGSLLKGYFQLFWFSIIFFSLFKVKILPKKVAHAKIESQKCKNILSNCPILHTK
jgi:hypothetical protein